MKTVLIIDDEEPTREMLKELVRRAGDFQVREARDGDAGLAVARRERPDLILLDLMMPNRNGYEVCAALRADPLLREVPIIVLSGSAQNRATLAALEAGADDFVRKPCDLPELRAKIATILRLNRYRGLAQERERLRWLIDRSNEPLLVADDSGRLVFANARCRDLFGLGDGVGQDALALIEQHFRCEPPDALARLREGGFRPGEDFAIFQPENEYVVARWFKVESLSGGTAEHELLLKFTDQTGQVRRDLETWAFQRMIFHKIRTPLNGLGNVLDLVAAAKSVQHDPNTASLLAIAQGSARRLEGSLLDVLSYHEALFRPTRLKGGGAPQAFRETVEAIGRETGVPSVSVQGDDDVDVGPEAVALLRPVLMEICENYAKFSSAAETGLTLTLARRPDGRAELRCFAPGEIPPPEAIALLGRPYWQVQRSFTGEIPGMGLGLATARLLLRSHGGDLHCRAGENPTGLVTTIVFRANATPPVAAAAVPVLA